MRRNGYLWTSGVNLDTAVRFLDPDYDVISGVIAGLQKVYPHFSVMPHGLVHESEEKLRAHFLHTGTPSATGLGRGFQKCNCFWPPITGHVIRCMRSGRVRIFNGNQWETLSLITQERIGVGASKLVGIIDVGTVGVDVCGILSRSVGQTNRK